MHLHEYLMAQRHKELLQEAERYQLISQARRDPVKRYNYLSRSLAWLGNRMCSWGSLLESRFGEQSILSQSQSMDRGLRT